VIDAAGSITVSNAGVSAASLWPFRLSAYRPYSFFSISFFFNEGLWPIRRATLRMQYDRSEPDTTVK
jgi:hypothetical protein